MLLALRNNCISIVTVGRRSQRELELELDVFDQALEYSSDDVTNGMFVYDVEKD